MAKIKIQHLANIKEVDVDLNETINDLKDKIEELFSIPASQQSLIFENRNISTAIKSIGEMGIKENSLIVAKKLHRFKGQSKAFDATSLMKNPMVKSMLKNPETIKSMKKMFPDLQEDNKTLSMLMNNGGLEDELEKMAADGDYMSTQMRNADLTMSKLENIPGGINMMSSMMRDVEEPFRWTKGSPLKVGHQIDTKMTQSIPGTNKRNALVEYRKQLSELRQIGFEDTKMNVEILKLVNGDLQAALEILVQKHSEI